MPTIALISENISREFENITKIKTYSLKPFKDLDTPVASHADMLICKIENNVFCYKKYYDENKELFLKIEKSGYNIIPIKKECRTDYPNDIALNVLIVGKKIFCRKESTANEILDYSKSNGYKIINVKQGYAACSVAILDEHHAITTDKGMEKILTREGIETICISPDKIVLPGYNCGFIGGASGVYEKTFFIFGKIKNLPDSEKIEKLLQKLNFKKMEITSTDVYDFGGIKFF